jgi:uridylate kinase
VRYRRILMKLSGGAIAGQGTWGFDPAALDHIADEILQLHTAGIQVAVMVGGGNIFKGELAETWGIERAEADNIGMMATVINSLLLRGVLQARGEAEVRVMTAIPINAVAEPYIRLRAIRHLDHQVIVVLAAGTGNPYVTTDYPAVQRALELRAEALLAAKHGTDGVYTGDPRRDPAARRYSSIAYDTVIVDNLQVLDQAAVLLARDYNLPVHVFSFDRQGAMLAICAGQHVGTLIGWHNALAERDRDCEAEQGDR